MKTCNYCGHQNRDEATTCRQCGQALRVPEQSPPAAERPRPWARVAVLQSEVEARRLELELNQRGIPHVLVSYEDSAFDGLYQMGRGWGHIETPPEQAEAVRALVTELRAGVPDTPGSESTT